MIIPNYDIAIYADDSTPYSTGKNLQKFPLDLEKIAIFC